MFDFANKLFDNEFTEHPKTFLIPEEIDELRDYMNETGHYIICKPDEGFCGGGIFIAQNSSDLKNLNHECSYACQRYINNPLCFGDRQRKIDYRVSFVHIDNGEGIGEVYYQTQNQGRAAVDTYKPLSEENKNDITTHITFYPELFTDTEKYVINENLDTWDDYCNFQNWNQVNQYYEKAGVKEFKTVVTENIKKVALKTAVVMRPFYKFMHKLKGIRYTKDKKQIFANFFGTDVIVDTDFNCHFVEYNLTPSCGDYNDSHNTGEKVNPVFLSWGEDAIELWLEYARNKYDGEVFGKKKDILGYTKILGTDIENPYVEEIKILERLCNLFWLFT